MRPPTRRDTEGRPWAQRADVCGRWPVVMRSSATASSTMPRPAAHAAPRGSSFVHIELRPLDSITPYDKNPRLNDGAVEAPTTAPQTWPAPPIKMAAPPAAKFSTICWVTAAGKAETPCAVTPWLPAKIATSGRLAVGGALADLFG